MADHVFVPRQKTIALHFKFFFFELHHEGRSQVDEVGITDVGKQRIRKTFGIFFEQFLKIRFPEKVDEFGKRFLCFLAMIAELEMVSMEKLYVLHILKIVNQFTRSPVYTFACFS